MKIVTIICVCGIWIAGCGGGYGSSSSSSSGGAATNISGNWVITTTSSGSAGKDTDTGAVTQSGSAVTASLSIAGSPCAQTGNLTGNISVYGFTAALTEGPSTITFTGTVANDGKSASGTYTSTTGGCTNSDSGTWTATMTSVSGAFVGQMMVANAMPVQITAQFNEERGMVIGTATAINSTCFNKLDVSGTISGMNADLSAMDENGGAMLAMTGMVQSNGDTINLSASGSRTESGSLVLKRIAP